MFGHHHYSGLLGWSFQWWSLQFHKRSICDGNRSLKVSRQTKNKIFDYLGYFRFQAIISVSGNVSVSGKCFGFRQFAWNRYNWRKPKLLTETETKIEFELTETDIIDGNRKLYQLTVKKNNNWPCMFQLTGDPFYDKL